EKFFAARETRLQSTLVALLATDDHPLSGKAAAEAQKLAGTIEAFAKKTTTDLGFFLDELLEKTGLDKLYEEEDRLLQSGRMENIAELRNSLLLYQRQSENASLGDYLQQISLLTSTVDDDEAKETVSLMTVHNAKGLEFETVIIAGFEKNFFPHYLAERDDTVSEERRLFYVAVTRAKNQLYFTSAQRRMAQGSYESTQPSPFLREIPLDLIRTEKKYDTSNFSSPVKKSFMPSAFGSGNKKSIDFHSHF
ncbi:MAG TPA: ATP-dependent helicase, partial [Turneriella sp.]|nr:ATP-dependent helicase [Turneriella sp.]